MNINSYLNDLFDVDLKKICNFYNIDYYIYYQNYDNNILKTNLTDSKDIMINKIINYIDNFIIIKPIIIKHFNVYFGNSYEINIFNNILYNQFDIYNIKIYNFLKSIGIRPSLNLYNIILNYWKDDKNITYFQLLNEYNKIDNLIFDKSNYDKSNLNKRYNAAKKIYLFIPIEYFKLLSNKVNTD